jgi:SAM-dependent methyltransferase
LIRATRNATLPPSADELPNDEYWNELCGSVAAQSLGVTGSDRTSLAAYDAWYFRHYPHLLKYIEFDRLRGRDVLEVGLGYGSVAQRLAEHGARYTGLDVAAGPVQGVNHRLMQSGLPGRAVHGSILDAPFPDEAFDAVIAIGSYHHTGDLPRALRETHRLLRPGGKAVLMIYNAESYVLWLKSPKLALRARSSADPLPLDARERLIFDQDSKGQAPPYTAVMTKQGFAALLLTVFAKAEVAREHVIAHRPFQFLPQTALNALFGKALGLNLYAVAIK